MRVGLFTAGLCLLSQQSTSRRAYSLVVAGIAVGIAQRSCRLGQVFPVSYNRVGTVTAETCGIGYARHGKVRFVEELRYSSGRLLTLGRFRRLKFEIDCSRLLRCQSKGLQGCVAVASRFRSQRISSLTKRREAVGSGAISNDGKRSGERVRVFGLQVNTGADNRTVIRITHDALQCGCAGRLRF